MANFVHRSDLRRFLHILLGGLRSCMLVALNAFNARRLPLALLVYSLVRPLMTTSETIRYSGVSLRNKNLLDLTSLIALVAAPRQQVPPQALAAHAAWVKGSKEIVALMLMTMDLDIQRNLTHLGAYDMLQEP
ncbi:hypothetical protein Tco_1022660 [Tanacetum coccineum]